MKALIDISIGLAPTCVTIGLLFFDGGCGSTSSRTPASSPAFASSASSPLSAPSAADCEELWTRYHAQAPHDPYTEHETFVARCGRSERAVLACPARVQADLADMLRESHHMVHEVKNDPPSAEPEQRVTEAELSRFAPIFVPPRMAICMARERLFFAQRSGELDALANDVATKKWKVTPDGVVVVDGAYATLSSQGYVELDGRDGSGPAPAGEVRVRTTSDGRVWLYFLGGLLGRHQNQGGFIFSSRPFVSSDFERKDATHERVCIGAGNDSSGAKKGERYLLPCFSVVTRHSPQLIEVGAAPD